MCECVVLCRVFCFARQGNVIEGKETWLALLSAIVSAPESTNQDGDLADMTSLHRVLVSGRRGLRKEWVVFGQRAPNYVTELTSGNVNHVEIGLSPRV